MPADAKKLGEDTFEIVRSCSNCKAILRFEITTLKAPKENYRVNRVRSTVMTYCPLCKEPIPKGDKNHICSGKKKEEPVETN